jgi:hypothetical protein
MNFSFKTFTFIITLLATILTGRWKSFEDAYTTNKASITFSEFDGIIKYWHSKWRDHVVSLLEFAKIPKTELFCCFIYRSKRRYVFSKAHELAGYKIINQYTKKDIENFLKLNLGFNSLYSDISESKVLEVLPFFRTDMLDKLELSLIIDKTDSNRLYVQQFMEEVESCNFSNLQDYNLVMMIVDLTNKATNGKISYKKKVSWGQYFNIKAFLEQHGYIALIKGKELKLPIKPILLKHRKY